MTVCRHGFHKGVIGIHVTVCLKCYPQNFCGVGSICESQGRSESTSSISFEVLIINCHIEFINLFIFKLFNTKYKFIHLQLFDFKFLFLKKHIFRKQKRTAVYGRTSLVSNFKLPRENDGLLSSRHR